MSYHVFYEPILGHVPHPVPSAALVQSASVKDWLDMTLEEWGPVSLKAVEAMRRFPGSDERNETGFRVAFGVESMFEYSGKREERPRVFGSAMGTFSRGWGIGWSFGWGDTIEWVWG